jgi:ABC-type molybdate transport system substrate-binding protein
VAGGAVEARIASGLSAAQAARPTATIAKRDTKPARGFIAFLVSAEGKAILQRFGFSSPS